VEEELRSLYRLQQIDLELDELNEGGGDITAEIAQLKVRQSDLTTLIDREESKLRDARADRADSNETLTNLRERLRTLNERLKTVRNNKEYEATTTEISAAEHEIATLERTAVTSNTIEANLIREIELLGKQRDEVDGELHIKSETLATIQATHADEVALLRQARVEAVEGITTEVMSRYNYIRSAHPDAVVRVRKGACSGCYRALPPQMQVEMRRLERLFTCEHCGRIVVDEEVAASVSVE